MSTPRYYLVFDRDLFQNREMVYLCCEVDGEQYYYRPNPMIKDEDSQQPQYPAYLQHYHIPQGQNWPGAPTFTWDPIDLDRHLNTLRGRHDLFNLPPQTVELIQYLRQMVEKLEKDKIRLQAQNDELLSRLLGPKPPHYLEIT